MSNVDDNHEAGLLKLTSYQERFVQSVLNNTATQTTGLRSHVGMGASTAIAVLVRRMLQSHSAGRALILCPAQLSQQWMGRVCAANSAAVQVDRYVFREWISERDDSEFWPSGKVCVLSMDLAKQEDVRERLSAAQWDLLVIDEAHRIVGQRRDLLLQLMPVTCRIVLLSYPNFSFDELAIGECMVIDWDFDLLETPFHVVSYTLTQLESRLWISLQKFCDSMVSLSSNQVFLADNLKRQACSSPVALESGLAKLLRREYSSSDSARLVPDEGEVDEEVVGPLHGNDFSTQLTNETKQLGTSLLHELEVLESDSKLKQLGEILRDVFAEADPDARVLVLTNFTQTVYYLTAGIEELGFNCSYIHGSMPTEDRQIAIRSFACDSRVLVATRAAIRELAYVAPVSHLIVYDAKMEEDSIRQMLVPLQQFQRDKPLRRVYVFVAADSN